MIYGSWQDQRSLRNLCFGCLEDENTLNVRSRPVSVIRPLSIQTLYYSRSPCMIFLCISSHSPICHWSRSPPTSPFWRNSSKVNPSLDLVHTLLRYVSSREVRLPRRSRLGDAVLARTNSWSFLRSHRHHRTRSLFRLSFLQCHHRVLVHNTRHLSPTYH